MRITELQSKVFSELPKQFNDTLVYHMDKRKISVAELAERANISERTIKRLRGSGEADNIRVVMGLCIGLQLEPELSMDLIRKAGFTFRSTDEHFLYQLVLHSMNHEPIDFVNKVLRLYDARPIGLCGEHLS